MFVHVVMAMWAWICTNRKHLFLSYLTQLDMSTTRMTHPPLHLGPIAAVVVKQGLHPPPVEAPHITGIVGICGYFSCVGTVQYPSIYIRREEKSNSKFTVKVRKVWPGADLECQYFEAKAEKARRGLRAKLAKLVISLVQEEDDTLPSDTAATTDMSYPLTQRTQTVTFTECHDQTRTHQTPGTTSCQTHGLITKNKKHTPKCAQHLCQIQYRSIALTVASF